MRLVPKGGRVEGSKPYRGPALAVGIRRATTMATNKHEEGGQHARYHRYHRCHHHHGLPERPPTARTHTCSACSALTRNQATSRSLLAQRLPRSVGNCLALFRAGQTRRASGQATDRHASHRGRRRGRVATPGQHVGIAPGHNPRCHRHRQALCPQLGAPADADHGRLATAACRLIMSATQGCFCLNGAACLPTARRVGWEGLHRGLVGSQVGYGEQGCVYFCRPQQPSRSPWRPEAGQTSGCRYVRGLGQQM